MLDLVFVMCPPFGVDYPPSGLNYLRRHIEKQGYKVKIYDLNIEIYKSKEIIHVPEENILSFLNNKKMSELWDLRYSYLWVNELYFFELFCILKSHVAKAVKIITRDSRLVGFSVNQLNRLFSIETANIIKEVSDADVIFGGPSCLIKRERMSFQKPPVDYIIIGEGEETLSELLKKKPEDNPNKLMKIPGLMVPGHADKFTQRRSFDITEQEHPSYLPTGSYMLKDRVSLYFSKGCIGRCRFCNDRNTMGEYRLRDPVKVFDELYHHVNNGIRKFTFNDLLINGNIVELEKLCDLIIDHGLKISWIANAIPMKNLTYKLLKKMKAAGCDTLMFGIESGSDKVIKHMGKYFTVESARRVLKDSKLAGIKNWINIIIGYPTETDEDFRMTLKFLEENVRNIEKICIANMCAVVFNSDLMDDHERYGIMLPDDSRRLEMDWYTEDNTPAIRRKRMKAFLRKAYELKLDVYQNNLKVFAED